MWMKWHHKFADGPGEYNWNEIASVDDATELSIEYSQEYSWSDNYIGISYEVHEAAPKEIIIEQLKKAQQDFVNLQLTIANLETQLENR